MNEITSIVERSFTFLVDNFIIKKIMAFFILIFYKLEIITTIMIIAVVYLVSLYKFIMDNIQNILQKRT